MPAGIQIGQYVDERGQNPGYGIGQQQHVLGRDPCEKGCQPHDPEQACAGQGHDHGGDGVPQAAHDAHDDLHDSAQEIGCADQQKPCPSHLDHSHVRRIDGQERHAEEVGAQSHDQSDDSHKDQSGKEDRMDPLRLSGSGVLAGKADDCLMDRVHGDVDKLLDAGGGAVSSHHHRSEGIDGGLDQHVGKGKERALYPGRQADLHHPAQAFWMDIKLSHVQAAGPFHPAQTEKDQNRTDALGKDGCQRHARHIQMQDDDEEKVQHHVDDAGRRQEIQRPFGISGGAQDGAAEIIGHGGGHSDKNDFQIQGGFVEHVVRSAHPDQ